MEEREEKRREEEEEEEEEEEVGSEILGGFSDLFYTDNIKRSNRRFERVTDAVSRRLRVNTSRL